MAKKLNTYDDLYAGRFLKAGNFNGRQVTLTIKGFQREELEGDDGKKVKAILTFEETTMQLVCCKTNGYSIKCMFGDHLADWIGKKVTFFPAEWNNEPAIRVWGSPDIPADKTITISLPKRKPFQMVMHHVVPAGPAPTAAATPPPAAQPAQAPPLPPTADGFDPDEFPQI